MKRILFTALLLWVQAVPGQPTPTPAPVPIEFEAERRRIQSERSQEAERYARKETACYARFAVTDCLLGNRAQRRETLDQLQKQESAIQAQLRKEKAFDQLQRVRDKAAAKDGMPAAQP